MRYLGSKGLSMTQARSVSNICNQNAEELDNMFETINNFKSSVLIDQMPFEHSTGTPIPDNIVDLVLKKSEYVVVQSYMMEAIKHKEALIASTKNMVDRNMATWSRENPEPRYPEPFLCSRTSPVTEAEMWETLSQTEMEEFVSEEAKASTIGKFIHKGSVLDKLRKELPTLKTLSWFEDLKGNSYPMTLNTHHTPEQLFGVYETLAGHHRKHEMRVNYYKAKVKNLTLSTNQEIARKNNLLEEEVRKLQREDMAAYRASITEYSARRDQANEEFAEEALRLQGEYAALRIVVPVSMKKLVDTLLEGVAQ